METTASIRFMDVIRHLYGLDENFFYDNLTFVKETLSVKQIGVKGGAKETNGTQKSLLVQLITEIKTDTKNGNP